MPIIEVEGTAYLLPARPARDEEGAEPTIVGMGPLGCIWRLEGNVLPLF